MLALPLLSPTVTFSTMQKKKVMTFLIMNVVCDICQGALQQNSSTLSEAKKLNCTGLQGHDSLFPLPNYSVHSTLYRS